MSHKLLENLLRQAMLAATRFQNKFQELSLAEDWEGVLGMERQALHMATHIEEMYPSQAAVIYFNLAVAHEELGNLQRAIWFRRKDMTLASKSGDDSWHDQATLSLASLHIRLGNTGKAMELHETVRARCGVTGNDVDAEPVIRFAHVVKSKLDFPRTIQILQDFLDVAQSQWTQSQQGTVYGMLAYSYSEFNDHAMAIQFWEKRLDKARRCQDKRAEAVALNGLGVGYSCLSGHALASAYFVKDLAIATDLGDIRGQSQTLACMGSSLAQEGGHASEAVEIFKKSLRLSETVSDNVITSETLRNIGVVQRELGLWDDAVESLMSSMAVARKIEDARTRSSYDMEARMQLGRVYLEQFLAIRSVKHLGTLSKEKLSQASTWTQSAVLKNRQATLDDGGMFDITDIPLDLAQQQFFLGREDDSRKFLESYLKVQTLKAAKQCEYCKQVSCDEAEMQVCGHCRVSQYCGKAHQTQAWRNGRLSHKVMCPLMRQWRKAQKGKASTQSCGDMFFEILRSSG